MYQRGGDSQMLGRLAGPACMNPARDWDHRTTTADGGVCRLHFFFVKDLPASFAAFLQPSGKVFCSAPSPLLHRDVDSGENGGNREKGGGGTRQIETWGLLSAAYTIAQPAADKASHGQATVLSAPLTWPSEMVLRSKTGLRGYSRDHKDMNVDVSSSDSDKKAGGQGEPWG
ncbi:hypothetical protein BGZ63DRAFT_38711 [Mariannaea sp. PMI_226]|nr:hypothetical protein BGZ63DRAFT_38711 [Mariannaea sp. PMI_226]